MCLSQTGSAGSFDNYLKPGDFEKATGLKGVKSITKHSLPGAHLTGLAKIIAPRMK